MAIGRLRRREIGTWLRGHVRQSGANPAFRLLLVALASFGAIAVASQMPGAAQPIAYLAIGFVYFSIAARTEPPATCPRLLPYVHTVINVGLVSLVSVLMVGQTDLSSLDLLYVVPVLVGSLQYGTTVGILTAVLSMAVYSYVFVGPPFTVEIRSLADALALVVFLMVASVTSQLATNARRQKDAAIAARQRAEALYEENRRLFEEAQTAASLRDLNQMKTQLLATVSHELRTPLSVVKAYTTALMRADIQRGETTVQEFLAIIDEEADKLGDMIGELLDLSRIEAGVLTIQRVAVQPARIAGRAVEQFAARHPDHHFDGAIGPELPAAEADPRRLEQILRNLLENAVKYSPPGSHIVVGAQGPVTSDQIPAVHDGPPMAGLGRWLVLWVADQGIGVAPEETERVFEPFHRGVPSGGVHSEGSGLGLAICRGLVEAQGGRIWLRSRPGQGSTFAFTLPVYGDCTGPAQAAPSPQSDQAATAADPPARPAGLARPGAPIQTEPA